jgi:carbamoyl-phosphate synthase large subunit
MAEDRALFREAMDRIGLENPRATIVSRQERPTANTTGSRS